MINKTSISYQGRPTFSPFLSNSRNNQNILRGGGAISFRVFRTFSCPRLRRLAFKGGHAADRCSAFHVKGATEWKHLLFGAEREEKKSAHFPNHKNEILSNGFSCRRFPFSSVSVPLLLERMALDLLQIDGPFFPRLQMLTKS